MFIYELSLLKTRITQVEMFQKKNLFRICWGLRIDCALTLFATF